MAASEAISPMARPMLLATDLEVPLITGEWRRYVNLDYAASTPPFEQVVEALGAVLPYYGSVHRGAGYKSLVTTRAYEAARQIARRFFQARPDDTVIFVRNTTDAINLLASSLPSGASIVAFASEHHANLLPWRRGNLTVTYLPSPASAIDAALELHRYLATSKADLVAITGASNVTGEKWPVAVLADIAHMHGARVLLDAAQLAPHCPIDIEGLNVDYVAASGHKMYAPFGAGVLIGRTDWLQQSDPFLRGGGAVDFVTTDDVLWTALPDRQEAGSPNVAGAVALGSSMQLLMDYGMQRLCGEEMALARYMRNGISSVPGAEVYGLWGQEADRIGVVAFNLHGYDHSHVAAILSAEYGVGVRHGCFCAHPLMLHILGVDQSEAEALRSELRRGARPRLPGAVRASIGIGTTTEEIDYLVECLKTIASSGPRWEYAREPGTGDYVPVPDTRPTPPILTGLTGHHGSGS